MFGGFTVSLLIYLNHINIRKYLAGGKSGTLRFNIVSKVFTMVSAAFVILYWKGQDN